MLYAIGLVIFFILVILTFQARAHENAFLKGIWVADAAFCENAELLAFGLHIGDNESYLSHRRYSYMFAANKNGMILNNPLLLKLSGVNVWPGTVNCRNYTATAEWVGEGPSEDIFPSEFQLAYYPYYGKIVLHKDGELLASLWKDHQMSAVQAGDSLVPDDIAEDIE